MVASAMVAEEEKAEEGSVAMMEREIKIPVISEEDLAEDRAGGTTGLEAVALGTVEVDPEDEMTGVAIREGDLLRTNRWSE
tara:strand:- start:1847 stop:2089 length:243 start_codon:yes stop_codon:yes gene_type:complete